VEQMHQIIIKAIAYVVDDKSFSVIQNLPRVPKLVGYRLQKLDVSGKTETGTDH
jgi:hypothetical protein